MTRIARYLEHLWFGVLKGIGCEHKTKNALFLSNVSIVYCLEFFDFITVRIYTLRMSFLFFPPFSSSFFFVSFRGVFSKNTFSFSLCLNAFWHLLDRTLLASTAGSVLTSPSGRCGVTAIRCPEFLESFGSRNGPVGWGEVCR